MPNRKEKRGNRRKLLCLAVCALLLAAGAFAFRTRTAQSLLSGGEIAGVSFLYRDIESSTSGACPQIEVDQPEMEALSRFLQDLDIRWRGFYGEGTAMDVPAYYLVFFDESGMPQVELYLTSTGYLYCGHMTYSIIAPASEEVWLQLGSLYALADDR